MPYSKEGPFLKESKLRVLVIFALFIFAVAPIFASDARATSLGEALDSPNLTWETGGNASWFAQNSVSYSGGWAAQSGPIIDYEWTSLSTTFTLTEPTTLSFYWKVSSEEWGDFLDFYIDNQFTNFIHGDVNWTQATYPLAAGSHTLYWEYWKDTSFASGSDSGWVDKVTLPYTLTASKSGAGSGTISSSPSGIACGDTCSAQFNFGTPVTLTATPASGSTFTGWSGEGCSGTGTCIVTVNAAKSVTATFTVASQYTLTTNKAGTGGGTISSSPSGINCGGACSADFNSGTQVTLTASPDATSTFAGWSGAGCSGTGTCSVTMDAAKAVTATFDITPEPRISVSPSSHDFRNVFFGQKAARVFNVTNTGTGSLIISDVQVEGDYFGIRVNLCAGRELAQSESCSVIAVFAPTDDTVVGSGVDILRLPVSLLQPMVMEAEGTLIISSNDETAPEAEIALNGTARHSSIFSKALSLKIKNFFKFPGR